MWPKFYKDYPVDSPLIKYPIEPGKGIIGCEMHELNGWGELYHVKKHKEIHFPWAKKENTPGILSCITIAVLNAALSSRVVLILNTLMVNIGKNSLAIAASIALL
ncbi:MAG TPA: hypothetical protein VIH61_05965 [Waddliaceae bacterium]